MQRRMGRYYEVWVVWFRTFAAIGLTVWLVLGLQHPPDDIEAIVFFSLLPLTIALFSAFTEWTFRLRRFVTITTDFETRVTLRNRLCEISLSFDEFCTRLVPAVDEYGYTVTGAENVVFISPRHWAIQRLINACNARRSLEVPEKRCETT